MAPHEAGRFSYLPCFMQYLPADGARRAVRGNQNKQSISQRRAGYSSCAGALAALLRQDPPHLANSPRPLTAATAPLCLLRYPTEGLQSSALPSSTVVLGLLPRQRSVPERLLFPALNVSRLQNEARPITPGVWVSAGKHRSRKEAGRSRMSIYEHRYRTIRTM